MFRRRDETRRRLLEVIEKFRQKGAISPDKAMTVDELGLPPRFEEAMKRRLGRLGIFVEVNGKYYLSEERLRQIEEQRSARWTVGNSRRKLLTLRILQIIAGVLFVTLLLINLFVQSLEIRLISSLFLIVWLAISIVQIHYLLRVRKRILQSSTTDQLV
jgi:hypothetical protein